MTFSLKGSLFVALGIDCITNRLSNSIDKETKIPHKTARFQTSVMFFFTLCQLFEAKIPICAKVIMNLKRIDPKYCLQGGRGARSAGFLWDFWLVGIGGI